MRKMLFLVFLLAGCTYQQTISSDNLIDTNTKTVAVETTDLSGIHQNFRQILDESGFRIYNQNNTDYTARYRLLDDINQDDNVRCGIFEIGYTYDIKFMDTRKQEEVFSMQGQGCRENVLKDFTALVNNRYDEKKEKTQTPEDEDKMRAPTLKSDGVTWWSN